jgi:hypothetical protein
MTDPSKVQLTHTQRAAFVYIRQSTPGQVEHNRESTARQYALADRACQLGWPKEQVVIIDEDLGLSGSSTDKRSGFAPLTSEVALAHVGIVLGLEVSRLARNNADWYRLLELCGITDTLIGDNDGVYHPALFNDRLLLGLKGTMSEAELHIIRARLGYLPSQPGAAGLQHPAEAASARRRVERGLGAVAGHRHLWPLRPPIAHSLSRPELDAGLPLRGQRHRGGTRAVLPYHGRLGHRAGRDQRVSRSCHASRRGSHAAHSRTTSNQPRRSLVAMEVGSGTCALRSGKGRAPLPERGAGE